jgi:hypothetical protein
VVNDGSLRAIPAPPDAVLPQAAKGPLGLVLLDTRFPRPPGDAGNPASWPVPVLTHVVPRAWPDQVVTSAQALREGPLPALFAQAMRELAQQGARAITTSCGFLVLLQRELQAAVPVPVVTSSLLLLPQLLGEQAQVGVLTISATSLSRDHLLAAGVPSHRLGDVVVQGVDPQGEFARAILGNDTHMDVGLAQRDVVQAACALKARRSELAVLVLECTNMPPYAQAVREATGLRVLSLFDALAF